MLPPSKMSTCWYIGVILSWFLIGCASSSADPQTVENPVDTTISSIPSPPDSSMVKPVSRPDTSDLERRLIEAGLVNIQALEPSIQVELKYASPDNFLGENVYGDIRRCYLQPEVADMLARAQRALQAKHPNLSLYVFDGVRPRSVQFMMWKIVKGTDQQQYVASPKAGSMHNYGASVDLGLATTEGVLIDMGTPFDFFGELAQPRYEERFLASGELTQRQIDNRRKLRAAMLSAGFHGILSEWWHFNAFSRDSIKQRYQAVE